MIHLVVVHDSAPEPDLGYDALEGLHKIPSEPTIDKPPFCLRGTHRDVHLIESRLRVSTIYVC